MAVNPEMIGRVYESLVNVSDFDTEQGDFGVFYTDRTEINFMCRRSLVEYLHNNLEKIEKSKLYEFVFTEQSKKQEEIVQYLIKTHGLNEIKDALEKLTVVDPACGSGSFLVGMMNIIAGLLKRIYEYTPKKYTHYEIKKDIIKRTLYGVDIKDWAVKIAELRLWLQLVIETDLTSKQIQTVPLLPNLSFKIRKGDSLIQKIGGKDFTYRKKGKRARSRKLAEMLDNLKQAKLDYFDNERKDEENIEQMETDTYRFILEREKEEIKKQIKSLGERADLPSEQLEMFDIRKPKQELINFDEQIKKFKEKIQMLNESLKSLLLKNEKDFVWDLDFTEIFSKAKRGFDIVIGNPPYVRQEKIKPPELENINEEKISQDKINKLKKEYKDKLALSIVKKFGKNYKPSGRSDLYVYFYFSCLDLLNDDGVFCFITSNSWLDVGYGKSLQEFLLNNVKIYAIYDNSAKRSFAGADINTIIALFSAPIKEVAAGFSRRDNLAKFVMFKKPFKEVITIENLLKIENSNSILAIDDFRVYPKKQKDLLEESWEYPEDLQEEQKKSVKFNVGKYTGNKWGGKYLRAPDIFFTILEKGKGKLVKLGDIAEVRFGIKTGANEFFYVEDVTDLIED